MKLVFAKEMQSLDQQSAEQIGLPTMVLMENAGKAVAETAADFLEDCFGKNIVVFITHVDCLPYVDGSEYE
jgi:NAD(P)H-hydrate repair Nnr-like enzyme with NAD(P)H-hydrate epimerase domain